MLYNWCTQGSPKITNALKKINIFLQGKPPILMQAVERRPLHAVIWQRHASATSEFRPLHSFTATMFLHLRDLQTPVFLHKADKI